MKWNEIRATVPLNKQTAVEMIMKNHKQKLPYHLLLLCAKGAMTKRYLKCYTQRQHHNNNNLWILLNDISDNNNIEQQHKWQFTQRKRTEWK
jgi:hypothetical protein